MIDLWHYIQMVLTGILCKFYILQYNTMANKKAPTEKTPNKQQLAKEKLDEFLKKEWISLSTHIEIYHPNEIYANSVKTMSEWLGVKFKGIIVVSCL